jgi:hypothetical protein
VKKPAPKAEDEAELAPVWANDALGRLTDAENEIMELQQAILARGDPTGQIELAILTKLRAALLLIADTRNFLIYEIPAMSTKEMQQYHRELLQDLRTKFDEVRKKR